MSHHHPEQDSLTQNHWKQREFRVGKMIFIEYMSRDNDMLSDEIKVFVAFMIRSRAKINTCNRTR